MSGDIIKNLKMAKEQPLNRFDLEYTAKLLEPFDDIIIERFTNATGSQTGNGRLFPLIAIVLVLIINFPKVRETTGLNSYVIWLISATILFGVVY
ncbi:hypothetical protein DH26_gp024 [Chloriridovirus anopheles1]|uniref:Uncharacterized protein n=1 Tax=Chloriridovirus anopheles1 TaxID=1465751 RepID=W8QMX7_9VIRU|nr:hypothetical protein DH26_gp024 [Anopheles minimus iridovirus]AHL67523.1 hypothetical protein AMIV_024 [Anopheles minimus iridovirus]